MLFSVFCFVAGSKWNTTTTIIIRNFLITWNSTNYRCKKLFTFLFRPYSRF